MSLRTVDYRCPEHGQFEELVSTPVKESHACPKCGADSVRVVSGAACVAPKYLAFRGDIRKRYTRA